MKHTNTNIKTLLASTIACAALLTTASIHAEDNKTEKTETPAAKKSVPSVSISISKTDSKTGKTSQLTPEIEAALKKALGDDKMVQTIIESITAAEKNAIKEVSVTNNSKNENKTKSSVSVISNAFIIGPDGNMQKIEGDQTTASTTQGSNNIDLSQVIKVFASAFGSSIGSGNAGDQGKPMLQLTDLKIKTFKDGQVSVIDLTPEKTADAMPSITAVQAELKEIKNKLAKQEKMLEKILQQLEAQNK